MPQYFFVSEAWKAVRICTPWEVHTKSSSYDGVVRCIRAVNRRPGVLATWTQNPVSVPYGFRKVHIQVLHWSVRMTYWLGNTQYQSWSPQSICIRPLRARARPIGTNRPADLVRNTYRAHTAVQGLLHAQNRRNPISGSCESFTYGHGLYGAPAGPKFCKNIVRTHTAYPAISHGFCT